MSGFTSILGDWHFWTLAVAYYAFAAAIGSLPSPDSTSGKFYAWFFKFANRFAANLSRAAQGKIPGIDVMPAPKPDILNAKVLNPVQPSLDGAQPAPWTEETMQIINRLTPNVPGKHLSPDWFMLRQRFEELESRSKA